MTNRLRSSILSLTLGAGVLALAPGHALAQAGPADTRRIDRILRTGTESDDYRLRVDTSLSLAERSQIDVGGYLAFTGLFRNDATNSTRLWQPEAVLYGRANIDGAHQFFVRGRFLYRTFSDGDSFDGRGDRWTEPFADRYWYEFDSRKAMSAYHGENPEFNFNLRVGRQFIEWGSGITLSETLYAVTPTIEFTRQFKLEGLAGITPDHTADFDGSRWSFDEKTRRAYFGGRLAYTFEQGDEVYGFVLHMVDNYNDNRARPPLTPIGFVNFKYDSTYFGLGSTGSLGSDWLYQVEGIFQTGQSYSDPLRGAQRVEDISAGAARLMLTYLLRDESQSRVEGELLYATGDGDRNNATSTLSGNLPGSTDHQFNALGYANTGLAFAPALSNLGSMRLGFSTFPFKSDETFDALQLGVDAFAFIKPNRRGPIDDVSSESTFLGGELDVYANWRITSDLSLTARYGIFLPSAGISGGRNARHFVLFGVTLAF